MTQKDRDTNYGLSNRPVVTPPQEGQGLLWHNLTDFYCNFFDLIEVMAIMIDMAGTIRMFNRKAEKLTGYSRAESVGKDYFSLLLPEPLRASAREKLVRGLENGMVPPAVTMNIVTQNGVVIPVDWSISVVRDDDGKLFGLVGLGHLPAARVPGTMLSTAPDNLYTFVEGMTHDLLNHSQVAMGYIELAIERADEGTELKCMLSRACNALKKCGEIAINVHKVSANQGTKDYALMTGSPKEI